jgi:hypothetical protein
MLQKMEQGIQTTLGSIRGEIGYDCLLLCPALDLHPYHGGPQNTLSAKPGGLCSQAS